MAIKAIAHSYWRRIKAGTRKIVAVPASVIDDVITLAKMDVVDGVITMDEYKELIGENFAEE